MYFTPGERLLIGALGSTLFVRFGVFRVSQADDGSDDVALAHVNETAIRVIPHT